MNEYRRCTTMPVVTWWHDTGWQHHWYSYVVTPPEEGDPLVKYWDSVFYGARAAERYVVFPPQLISPPVS
jgi:hypothetical protein